MCTAFLYSGIIGPMGHQISSHMEDRGGPGLDFQTDWASAQKIIEWLCRMVSGGGGNNLHLRTGKDFIHVDQYRKSYTSGKLKRELQLLAPVILKTQ